MKKTANYKNMNKMLFANKIRTLREQNGMLQRKVAAELDMDAD